MAPHPEPPALPPNKALLGLCSALLLALLLCGLCSLCRRRRKRMMKTVCPGGMALVDVTLLRQTQLRSLSKSDTKLHEIKRPPPRDSHLRPVSMDPLYHSPNWQVSANTDDNTTYSNLNYTLTPLKSHRQKGAGHRGELNNTSSEPRVTDVTAEYAVVRKAQKGTTREDPRSRKEEKKASLLPFEEPCLPHRPEDLDQIEAMYSKVNKKKKVKVKENAGPENMASNCTPPPKPLTLQPEENLYESICEMSSHAM